MRAAEFQLYLLNRVNSLEAKTPPTCKALPKFRYAQTVGREVPSDELILAGRARKHHYKLTPRRSATRQFKLTQRSRSKEVQLRRLGGILNSLCCLISKSGRTLSEDWNGEKKAARLFFRVLMRRMCEQV